MTLLLLFFCFLEHLQVNSKPHTLYNVRGISSFNVAGMPFGKKYLDKKRRIWRIRNDEYFFTFLKHASITIDNKNDLFISAFSEAWRYPRLTGWVGFAQTLFFDLQGKIKKKRKKRRTLLGGSFIQLESRKSLSLLNKLCSTMPATVDCRSLIVNPPQKKIKNGKKRFLSYKYTVNYHKHLLKYGHKKCMDNGLLILSNWKPIQSGKIHYKTTKKQKKEITQNFHELLATKGFIWAKYYNSETFVTTLVFSTHITTAKNLKEAHYKQLIAFIKSKKKKWYENEKSKIEESILEIFVLGDFNLKLYERVLIEFMDELNLENISTKRRSVDHIFVWRSNKKETDFIEYANARQLTYNPPKNPNNDPKAVSDHYWIASLVDIDDENVEIGNQNKMEVAVL
eukprot:451376_1